MDASPVARSNVKIANNGRPMIMDQAFFNIKFLPKDNCSYCDVAPAWKDIQLLGEIKVYAEQGDVAWLARHGIAYAAMQPV